MVETVLPANIVEWVESRIGSRGRICEVSKLAGSTSSDLYKIRLGIGEDSSRFVLRLFSDLNWLSTEPDIAKHEAAALKLARTTGIQVPEIIGWEEDCRACGVPAVLMTWLPGQVSLSPVNLDQWLTQQAMVLLPIHALSAKTFGWKYFPYVNAKGVQVPERSKTPKNWQNAIEIVNKPPPDSPYCFIHRDYHPMNTLWQGDELSGVVDWVNACHGPASFDIAWNRINLAKSHGVTVAEKFLSVYESLSGTVGTYHPFWDLMALIEVLPGPPTVYEPWKAFGLRGLNKSLMIERIEQYLDVVLRKF